MDLVIKNGLDLRLAGIIRPNDNKAASVNGVFGYTSALSDYIIQKTNESEIIVREQKSPENVNLDVLSRTSFHFGLRKRTVGGQKGGRSYRLFCIPYGHAENGNLQKKSLPNAAGGA